MVTIMSMKTEKKGPANHQVGFQDSRFFITPYIILQYIGSME